MFVPNTTRYSDGILASKCWREAEQRAKEMEAAFRVPSPALHKVATLPSGGLP